MNIEKAKTVLKIEEDFLPALTKFVGVHFSERLSNLTPPTFEALVGRKNAKIVKVENGRAEYVHCFIDLATGDVLKAASWKAPAKHSRGNIFTDENCSVGVGVGLYGANYLR